MAHDHDDGGVPKDIVDKLAGEIRAIMSEPEVQKLLTDDGAHPADLAAAGGVQEFVDSRDRALGRGGDEGRDSHSQ